MKKLKAEEKSRENDISGDEIASVIQLRMAETHGAEKAEAELASNLLITKAVEAKTIDFTKVINRQKLEVSDTKSPTSFSHKFILFSEA